MKDRDGLRRGEVFVANAPLTMKDDQMSAEQMAAAINAGVSTLYRKARVIYAGSLDNKGYLLDTARVVGVPRRNTRSRKQSA